MQLLLNTRMLEDVVWKTQQDAGRALRSVWIAPSDAESREHLARARAFRPQMDATVRRFIARQPGTSSFEGEIHALVEALRETTEP